MFDIKFTRIYNITNMWLRYNWYLNFIDIEIIINLKLQSKEKDQKCITPVMEEFSHFQDFLLILIIFLNKVFEIKNRRYTQINILGLDKTEIMSRCSHILLSSIYLFNIRR